METTFKLDPFFWSKLTCWFCSISGELVREETSLSRVCLLQLRLSVFEFVWSFPSTERPCHVCGDLMCRQNIRNSMKRNQLREC